MSEDVLCQFVSVCRRVVADSNVTTLRHSIPSEACATAASPPLCLHHCAMTQALLLLHVSGRTS
jgi:hypothetical protein